MPPSASAPSAFPLYITGFAAFIGLYLPQPILPLLAQEFQVDAKAASLVISLTVLGLALASPFVAVLSDRFGRKRLLIVSASILAVLMLACAVSTSFTVLLVLRFSQGLVLPGLFVVAVAYTSERLDKAAMTRAAGIYVAATVIGGMMGRLLAGSMADVLSWRYSFVIASGCYIGLVALWLRQVESQSNTSRTLASAFWGMVRHLKNRDLVSGLAIGFCLFFAFQSTFNYLPFKLAAAPFHLTNTLISLMYLSFIAGMASSSQAGRFTKHLRLKRSIVLGLLLACLGNLMTLGANLSLIIIGLLVLCFGNWLVQGLAVGYVATATTTERAGANALYLLFYYLGGSLGGTLPGFFFDDYGYAVVVLTSLIMLMVGIGFAATLSRKPPPTNA